jgi:hypothetical protein
MTRRLIAAIAAGALLAGAANAPALAHHSFAMFDGAKVVTLKGTVTEFDWSNPHVSMTVSVPSAQGAPEIWTVELTSPGNLGRLGWTRHSLKPGDHVAVEVNPLRDGKHGGGFRQVTLVDSGQVLGGALRDLEKQPPK